MADNKKYYYLKLNENFFDQQKIQVLEGMKEGDTYVTILLKLYLKSLMQEGRLMLTEYVPYDPETLSAITHKPVAIIEKAIKIFMQYGFVEILDNGAIYMTDIQNFIGQSSSEADRIREYRKRINAEKAMISKKEGVTNVHTDEVQMYNKSTPEIRDKSIEIRDYNKEFKNKEQSIEDRVNTLLVQSSENQSSVQKEAMADVEAIQLNTGEDWRPLIDDYNEYCRLYPNVNVASEFAKMRAWSLSNPTRRKTAKGIKRFVNSWLSKAQDKGGKIQYSNAASSNNSDYLQYLLEQEEGKQNG